MSLSINIYILNDFNANVNVTSLLAPRIFYMVYAAIRPFLSERTRQKVHIFAGAVTSIL